MNRIKKIVSIYNLAFIKFKPFVKLNVDGVFQKTMTKQNKTKQKQDNSFTVEVTPLNNNYAHFSYANLRFPYTR